MWVAAIFCNFAARNQLENKMSATNGNLKERIRTVLKNKLLLAYLLTILSFLIVFYLFAHETGMMAESPVLGRFFIYPGISHIVVITAEILLFSLPVLVCRGKWRIVSIVLLWVVSLFLFANMLYYRYWCDFIPFTLMFKAASYNSIVFKSVPSMVCWEDILFALVPGLLTWYFIKKGVLKLPVLNTKWRVTALVLTLLFLFSAESFRAYRRLTVSNNKHIDGAPLTPVTFMTHLPECFEDYYKRSAVDRLTRYKIEGLLMYVAKEAATLNNKIKLTEADRREIETFISLQKSEQADSDSIFCNNRNKNLIFIVVESLNSAYIGKESGGRSISPTLDSLLSREGTISCLSVVTQIRAGSSSDGQLMYNTGILPLQNGVASMDFGDNRYPSLADAIGYKDPTEIIVESQTIWNHGVTSKGYGYSRLMDNLQSPGKSPLSLDGILFKVAVEDILHRDSPHMTELTTLTMHGPFYVSKEQQVEWVVGENEVETRYMRALNEFDKQLGIFLDRLKKSGTYDNSVIVLASDHHTVNPENNKDYSIAFIALNTGKTLQIKKPVGQVDVYPTVLEIMGRDSVE